MTVFRKYEIFGKILDNRLVASPMCQYASNSAGIFLEWHKFHYLSLACTGVSTIVVESCSVNESGKISDNDLCIYNEQHCESHKNFVKTIKKYYPHVALGIQISHSGRKSKRNNVISSASPIPIAAGSTVPSELTKTEIHKIFGDYSHSVKLAMLAGYDFCELHMAHGYLIHQFLSPCVNKRADSFSDPIFFIDQLLERVFNDGPIISNNFKLGARITGADWVKGGIQLEDSVAVAHQLEKFNFSYIDVSSGGIIPITNRPSGEYFQSGIATSIKKSVSIPVRCAGEMWDLNKNNALIDNGELDFISLGRLLVRNPGVVREWAKLMKHPILFPKPYQKVLA